MHHAVNERYLDRNYGGILIVWDRLFGTFVEEDDRDPPVYGTRRPLRSWNPLWANVEVYSAMAHHIRHAHRWRDRFRVLIGRTGWRPDDRHDESPDPFRLDRPRYAPLALRGARAYAVVQFAIVLAATVHFLQVQEHAPMLAMLAYFVWIAIALTTLGWMLEGRRLGAWLEAARCAGTFTALLATQTWFGIDAPAPRIVDALAMLALASAVWAAFIAWR